jgi:glycerol-3-phosphate acyltransferase PlsY
MSPAAIIPRLLAAAIAGYLLGSLPSGVLVGKLFGNVDPRTQGSGKTGTTNVLRTLGPGAAALVLVMDVGKGLVAVLLARYGFMPHPPASLNLQGWAEAAGGFAALLGHNYSIFIHFTGGRGVATGGGAMLAVSPFSMLVAIIALVTPVVITRYVSLGSIMGATFGALTDVILAATGHDSWPHAIFLVAGASFIIFHHRDNIERLLAGTERKLGAKKATTA